MNGNVNNFYNKYMNITLKKIKFIDIYIIFNLFNIILLSIYAFIFSLFKEKIAHGTIFTAIGNVTLLIALRVQITNKTLFSLKQEKIIFDFVLCSLILYIGYILNLNKGGNHNFIILNRKYADKKQRVANPHVFRNYMKRLRNATVEIDIENRKDLTKIEIIKMFLKGVRECKNVEIMKEKAKGHVPPTTKRKLMKQKRMVNLRNHIKNDRIKKQEYVNPNQNILNFPKNQIKNINAAVLYFKHYFEKYENNEN